ncbi:hypothetical protein PT285_07735 [Lactobacillus sp. ESL0791]|uniref:DUF6933 domain-containing protein n=1 Tax=Lactobacillus sp. ESL0791 TaxID=2983234 RepID=UPI0023F7BDA6|nr:hypothetical protein [Lactobacillus sp. ESL0791]MDF7639290.1 hypothetical protein [Lactobacillus sp. ESL0791]
MIIYATKQTFDRYKIKEPAKLRPPVNELAQAVIKAEAGDELLEWGAKLFYFERKKCLQLVNFASKFTLFLFDIKMDDMEELGEYIKTYLLELYKDDAQMIAALNKMFAASPILCFDRLKNRSIIATLNHTQLDYADDGYAFYDYLRDGVLHTVEINKRVNFEWIIRMKVNGKTDYHYPGERFRKIVLARFGK